MATEIATLGEFGLIKRLTQNIEPKNGSPFRLDLPAHETSRL